MLHFWKNTMWNIWFIWAAKFFNVSGVAPQCNYSLICFQQCYQTISLTRVLTKTQEVAPRLTWGRFHVFLLLLTFSQTLPLSVGQCLSWWLLMPSWHQVRYAHLLPHIFLFCFFTACTIWIWVPICRSDINVCNHCLCLFVFFLLYLVLLSVWWRWVECPKRYP